MKRLTRTSDYLPRDWFAMNLKKIKKDAQATVYLARAVRCDSEEKLARIVDHFRSKAHAAEVDAKKFKEPWKNQVSKKPPMAKKSFKSETSIKSRTSFNLTLMFTMTANI